MAKEIKFTLKIDGVETAYENVVKLGDALGLIKDTQKNTTDTTDLLTSAIREQSEAEKEFEASQQKINALESESAKILIEAKQSLDDKTAATERQVAINTAAEGSIKQLNLQIEDLKTRYEALSEEERTNSEVGGVLLDQIDQHTKAIAGKSAAEKEFEATQQQINALESESAKILIEAKQSLDDKTAATERQVAINTAAEGSIKQLNLQIEDLKIRYEALSEEERNNSAVGGVLLDQIDQHTKAITGNTAATEQQVTVNTAAAGSIIQLNAQIEDLKDQYSNLSESERENSSVGGVLLDQIQVLSNEYGSITEKFGKFTTQIDGVVDESKNLLTIIDASKNGLALFGIETESAKHLTEDLGKVMAVLNSIQEINNLLKTKGTMANALFNQTLELLGIKKKADTVATVANTAAQTANATATGGATIATNLFSKALTATGIGAIVVLIGSLIAYWDELKKGVLDAIPGLKDTGDTLDKLTAVSAGVGEALLTYILTPLRVIGATVGKLLKGDLEGAFDEGLKEVKKAFEFSANYQKGYNDKATKLSNDKLRENARISANEVDNVIKDNEAKYGSDWKYTQEGRLKYQEYFDAKKKMYTEDTEEAKQSLREIERANKQFTADGEKHDADVAKRKADAARQAAQKRSQDLEDYAKNLDSFRKDTLALELEHEQRLIDKALEGAKSRNANTKEELEERNRLINDGYAKQIILNLKNSINEQDIAKKNFDELIAAAKKAGKSKEEIAALEIDLQDRLGLIRHENTIDEIKLNEERNKAIEESNKGFKESERNRLQSERAEKENAIKAEYDAVKNGFAAIQKLNDEALAKGKGKNGMIDVEATKKNLEAAKQEMNNYLATLSAAKKEIEMYYDSLMGTYDKDSKEYKDLATKKNEALTDIESKTKATNKSIEENNDKSSKVVADHWKEVGAKTQEYVNNIMTGVNAIFSGMNALLKDQLEEAKEKYDTITKQYDEMVAKRKESNDTINQLEEEAKNASGGRAMTLRVQIDQEMAKNAELAKQEAQLAKEKEKATKDKEKKEKQAKKVEVAQGIIQGIANTALAVTNALKVSPFPLALILAGVAGAAGAVQVAVMSKQLAKLEDGGLLRGKRHSQGGMRIQGTNIEVEGGEYVVNREATANNLGLVRYINAQRKPLTPADINSYFSKPNQGGHEVAFRRMFETGGELPVIEDKHNVDNEAMLEAIRSIKFAPQVAVTDIIRVQDQMTQVDSWTGM